MFRIREISEAGSVPELLMENGSQRDILILDGDQLVGAKQNRVAIFTIIVAAFSKLIVPVSCVEQGRWRWKSREFNSSKHFMYASLRSRKATAVTDNLMARVTAEMSQGSIWQEISGKASRLGTSSPTMAMDDLYSVSEAQARGLIGSITCQPGQVGFLVFIRDGFAGGDMLLCPELFEKKYAQLLGSYTVDAFDSSAEFPRLSVGSVLDEACRSNVFSVPVPGKGENLRFRSDQLSGSAKLLDDQPVYLSFFPVLKGAKQPGRWPQWPDDGFLQ
jgi:hypothetical protein